MQRKNEVGGERIQGGIQLCGSEGRKWIVSVGAVLCVVERVIERN